MPDRTPRPFDPKAPELTRRRSLRSLVTGQEEAPPPTRPSMRAPTLPERSVGLAQDVYEALASGVGRVTDPLLQSDFAGKAAELTDPAPQYASVARRRPTGTWRDVFDQLLARSRERVTNLDWVAPRYESAAHNALLSLVMKWPRLAEHIESVLVARHPWLMRSTQLGGEQALGYAFPVRDRGEGFAGAIRLHPDYDMYGISALTDSARNTMGHEAAHVAQFLRLRDSLARLKGEPPRAMAGLPPRSEREPFTEDQILQTINEIFADTGRPYMESPFEIAARTSGAATSLRYGGTERSTSGTRYRRNLGPESGRQGTQMRKLAEALALDDIGLPVPAEFDRYIVGTPPPAPLESLVTVER